jgi:hypothetical protein
MRIVLAAAIVLATSVTAFAAPAPNFSDMTQKQVQAFFANKTALDKLRWGNVAFYFRSNSTLYMGGAGSSRVEKSKWSVSFVDNKWQICFATVSRWVPAAQSRITVGLCDDARHFLREADDFQAGDPLKLSSGKLKIDLGTKKTTLAKLAGKR